MIEVRASISSPDGRSTTSTSSLAVRNVPRPVLRLVAITRISVPAISVRRFAQSLFEAGAGTVCACPRAIVASTLPQASKIANGFKYVCVPTLGNCERAGRKTSGSSASPQYERMLKGGVKTVFRSTRRSAATANTDGGEGGGGGGAQP